MLIGQVGAPIQHHKPQRRMASCDIVNASARYRPVSNAAWLSPTQPDRDGSSTPIHHQLPAQVDGFLRHINASPLPRPSEQRGVVTHRPSQIGQVGTPIQLPNSRRRLTASCDIVNASARLPTSANRNAWLFTDMARLGR